MEMNFVAENLQKIREKLKGKNIRLIAVSKGQPVKKISEALHAGQTDFGENYVQELLEHVVSVEASPDGPPLQIHWHFIGHLQKNKVRLIIDKVDLIHSLDSYKLAIEIDKRAKVISKIQPVLIEVNLGGEETKSGIAVEEVAPLIEKIQNLLSIDLQGFMSIPPYRANPEDVRPYFKRLREIRDEINKKKLYKHPLTQLSMGMSHDFQVALEEGATLVRIGTGIFGERQT